MSDDIGTKLLKTRFEDFKDDPLGFVNSLVGNIFVDSPTGGTEEPHYPTHD